MRLSVVIPTYKRPDDLSRLLNSLFGQTELLYEVLIIVGPGDDEGLYIAKKWEANWPIIQVHLAIKPSVIHSLNLSFTKVKGDIICLLDDDVWLPSGWSSRIKTAYEKNSSMGVYGGRDHLQHDNPALSHPPLSHLIGTYQWNLGLVGNHHCGLYKSPALIDVAKGCNLSFRRTAFVEMQIDTILESAGAETCWEIDICQRVRLAGFDVVYDNNNYVLHYASPRMAFDNRNDSFTYANSRRVFNEAFVTAKFRPILEIIIFCLRSFLIGSRLHPGLLWSFLLLSKLRFSVLKLPWHYMGCIKDGISHGFQQRSAVPALKWSSKNGWRVNLIN